MIETLEPVYNSGHALLRRYAGGSLATRTEILGALRPTSQDFQRLFVASVAAFAEAEYEAIWPRLPLWTVPASPELSLWCATGDELRLGRGEIRAFPDGYRSAAYWLQPDIAWAKVAMRSPRGAIEIDGLAYVEPGRWVWCPQPWRFLPAPPAPQIYWD